MLPVDARQRELRTGELILTCSHLFYSLDFFFLLLLPLPHSFKTLTFHLISLSKMSAELSIRY